MKTIKEVKNLKAKGLNEESIAARLRINKSAVVAILQHC